MTAPEAPKPSKRAAPLNAVFGLTRLIVEFGVLSSFLFSLVLFVSGTVRTVVVIWEALPTFTQAKTGKALLIAAIEQTDNLLIATALLIISLGLQTLFVGRVFNLPAWLHIETFDDLKQKLLGIVVVALAVKFFSVAVDWEAGGDMPSGDILSFGLGVGAVMLVIAAYSVVVNRLGTAKQQGNGDAAPDAEPDIKS